MKKILLLMTLVLFLVGCAKEKQDEFVQYRNQSSSMIFNGAEKALADKDYSSATKMFEALDAIYPFGPYAQQAQLDIIYAYYMNGDDASAIAAADRYIQLYPRGQHVDYAYYMHGIVGFSLGLSWLQKFVGTDPAPRDITSLQQSFSSFASIVHYFPHSQYAPDSLLRMSYVRNLVARRQIEIAQFYMEHDAYVAAGNRASYVVQHFQGSPQVIKALVIMVEAYRKLGLHKLAEDSYKILKTNYPHTPELSRLPRA